MAKKASVQEPEILAPEHPDHAVIKTDGYELQSFMAGLTTFFRGARALEEVSLLMQAKARAMKPPTTMEEDAELQEQIISAREHIKAVKDYWAVTSLMDRLHGRFVAGRNRGVDPAKELQDKAQEHHNAFVAERKRLAQLEQDRLNREAQEKARQEREAELARLEQQALDAEAASDALSDREKRFVELVAGGMVSPESAARTAGYKDAFGMADRLMASPKIQAAIQSAKQAQEIRRQAEAVKSAPVVAAAPVAKVEVAKVGSDRTTYSVEVYDESAFMAALLDPTQRLRLGIPADVATFSQTKLNDVGRQAREAINKWPGVRLVDKTSTVR